MHMKVSDEMKFQTRVELSMLNELRGGNAHCFFVTNDFFFQ